MLTPAAKRRRAEAASATLSRPFRSPSICRGGAVGTNTPKVTPELQEIESKRALKPSTSDSTTTGKDKQPTVAASPERIHKRRTPPSRLKEDVKVPKEEPSISLGSLVDQFCLDLDAGDKIIKDARISANEQKQTTTRTKKKPTIEDSKDNNDELRQLIIRWKEAGRLAADELFSIVSDRVTAVGGVKAWRAMSLSQPQEDSINKQKNAGGRRRNQENDNSGKEDSQYEDEENYEDDAEDNEEDDDKVEESQDFTMATMLASMGVDLSLLGYDEAEEGWKG